MIKIKINKPSFFSGTVFILWILLLAGCVATQSFKIYVTPSIHTYSVKSIASFSLRNTALNQSEILELDAGITIAFQKKNSNVKITGVSEATAKLNEKGLADEFNKFFNDFVHSGIIDSSTIKKIGIQLGIDAILAGTIADVIQEHGVYPTTQSETSLTLVYALFSTRNGSILWESSCNASKRGTTLSKAPSLFKVVNIAQNNILTRLPELGN